jgi:glycogen(starch) synthase
MRFSVVINTYNRAASLRDTLDALRQQTLADFEVVVVNGPSDDGTDELLAERADAVRVVRCPERNLSVSRNLGIDAAAGDVVALIDDDAIPEPRWLADLTAGYDAEDIGGAGGLTLDNTGVRAQYRYSVCDRIGRTNFDQRPPLDAFNRPGANPFLYLQGTNCSFRREVLERISGFDEEIEYNYDEAEVCSRVIDAGYRLAALEGAVVHHKFLPSHLRRATGFTDPYYGVKNRVYFALRVGREAHHDLPGILVSLTDYLDREVRPFATAAHARGDFTAAERDHYLERAEAGFALGLERGLAGVRRGRDIAPADPSAFKPYPRVTSAGRRLAVGFVTIDHPPKPIGGIARFTADLAAGFAAGGHEAHIVTRDDDGPYRVDLEDGVWVHRFPVADRWIAELDGHPLKHNLDHLAAVNSAVGQIAHLDVVAGSLWIAEPLLCALDPERVTTVACNTPMAKVAELQPHTAAAPLTPHQIRLEEALLRSPAHLQPVSHENERLCRELVDRPMTTIHHGIADRAGQRGQSPSSGVEVLFVGRLEPRKGIDTLLEAAGPLLAGRPDVRLRIVGADNPHANGRPDAFAGYASEQVIFAGELEDDALFDAYAGADVFCGPSRYESFGLVHVEAMMMGLPVAACDVGGMRETVVDGETGLLVAPGDAEALRGALERLVEDADLRARMGAAGRARYEAEFTVEVAVARNVAFFETLTAPGGAPQRAAVADMLTTVCDLEPAAAQHAAAELLDPRSFPRDPARGVRAAHEEADDRAFLRGAFQALLGRFPDPEGEAVYVHRLGLESRVAIVREIALSDEASVANLSPDVVDRLPAIDGRDVAHQLIAPCFDDDEDAFLAELDRIVAGGTFGAEQLEAWRGLSRAEAVRAALDTRIAAQRVGGRNLVDPDSLHTTREVIEGLQAATGDDGAFIEAAYRLILGRHADDYGVERFGWMLRAGIGHAVVVDELARCDEAMQRGVPGSAADRMIAAFASPPGPLRQVARRLRGGTPQVVTEGRVLRAISRVDPPPPPPAPGGDGDGTREEVRKLAGQVEELSSVLDVVARKNEALAMDLREKLPATTDAPEPTVVNPEALAAAELRINVGCGEQPLRGYVNVDFRELPGVDVVADAARMPFEPGSLKEVASYHLIEHFREHHARTVLLPHWRSLLRPDGMLRVITPNWEVMIEHLQAGRLTFAQFKQVTFGLQDYSGDDHFALYSPETLTALLESAGFTRVQVLADRRQNGLSPEMELLAWPAAG